MTRLDELSNLAIAESIKIHRATGPGMLESVYEAILMHSFQTAGIEIRRQQPVRIQYNGVTFDEGFRVDLLVESIFVIEIKSAVKVAPVYSKQLLTYLRLMKLPLGLLINFGGETLREGIKRIVNDLQPQQSELLRVNQFPG